MEEAEYNEELARKRSLEWKQKSLVDAKRMFKEFGGTALSNYTPTTDSHTWSVDVEIHNLRISRAVSREEDAGLLGTFIAMVGVEQVVRDAGPMDTWTCDEVAIIKQLLEKQ